MTDLPVPLDDPLDPEIAAYVLGLVEGLLDQLATDAFTDERLYVRAQSISEILDAGLAAAGAIDRPGRARPPRPTGPA